MIAKRGLPSAKRAICKGPKPFAVLRSYYVVIRCGGAIATSLADKRTNLSYLLAPLGGNAEKTESFSHVGNRHASEFDDDANSEMVENAFALSANETIVEK